MATGEPAYNPSIGGSNPTPPVTIDGTGLTTTVPLLVKNGKSQSGVEVQVTSTLSSGFELNDSTGTLKGAFGLAGASAGWVSDSAVSDVVIGAATSSRIRFGVFGSATVLNVDCTNNIVTLNSGNKLAIDSSNSTTTTALQVRGDANTGLAQTAGADTLAIVCGGARTLQCATTSTTVLVDLIFNTNVRLQLDSANSTATVAMQIIGDADTGVGQIGGANTLGLVAGGTEVARAGADFIISPAGALATNATTGFLRLPTCAGAPTGAATNGAIIIDTTNGKLYLRIGGAWVGGTVPGAFV